MSPGAFQRLRVGGAGAAGLRGGLAALNTSLSTSFLALGRGASKPKALDVRPPEDALNVSDALGRYPLILKREDYKDKDRRADLRHVVHFSLLCMLTEGLATLPYAFRGVGWVLGFAIVIFCWLAHFFTGTLLGRCRNIYPGAVSLADLAVYTVGPRAMFFTYALVTTVMVFMLAEYVVVVAYSLQTAVVLLEVEGWLVNYVKCAFTYLGLACIVLVPLSQFRTLYPSSVLCAASNAILFVSLVFWGWSLISGGQLNIPNKATVWPQLGKEYSVGPSDILEHIDIDAPAAGAALTLLQSVALISFSFSFQIVTLEIIAEMRKPGQEFFPSLAISSCVQLLAAVYVSAIGYWHAGNDSPSFFLAQLVSRPSWVTVTVSFLYAVHVLIGAMIKVTILLRSLQLFIHPQNAGQSTWQARVEWFALSIAVIFLLFGIAVAVPFYEVLAAFIGAACMPPVTFTLPTIFYVIAMRKSGRRVPMAEWVAIVLLNLVAAVLMTAGVVHVLIDLVEHWQLWARSEFRGKAIMKCLNGREFMFQFTDAPFEETVLREVFEITNDTANITGASGPLSPILAELEEELQNASPL